MSSYLMIFGKPRYLGLLENDREEISPGIQLVTESARGEEISLAAGPITPEQAEYYRNDLSTNGGDGAPRGGEPAFQEIRLVRNTTEEDLAERKSQAADEEIILVKGRELLKAHPLDMKLVDVEFLLDRKKLFFYFTAEQRIDFRSYVRDLAREFKTRIELRQIGVRDESKVVKGLSPCGMPCCCSYWLNRFAPICIRMVKEQNLALNPTKISGICGRLMCCMGYEHNTYRELWKSLPGPGSKIKTPTSTCVVSGVDVAREKVRVFCPGGGGEFLVDINDFQSFRETIMKGETWEKDIDSGAVSLSGIDTGNGPEVLTGGGKEDQGCEARISLGEKSDKKVQIKASEPVKVMEKEKEKDARRPGRRRKRNTPVKKKEAVSPKPPKEENASREPQAMTPSPPKAEGKKRPRRRKPRNSNHPLAGQ